MGPEEIHYISSSTVYPATYKDSTPAQRIDLTPWDLQFLQADYNQKGLLFHKPTPNTLKDHSLIHLLETSLSSALDAFFPLAGRFSVVQNDDNTVTYFLYCNNAGAQLIHAVADNVKVANILEPCNVPAIVRSFFPLNAPKNHQGVSEPLLSVQVTELLDGIFIGCSINHAVCDGSSFWHFINHWSGLSSNPSLYHLHSPPSLKRWFVDEIRCPVRLSSPVFDEDSTDAFSRTPSLQERVLHFSKETIQKLKKQANEEMGTTNISSLQALLAHLWCAIIRCSKNVEGKEETKLVIPASVRQRVNPLLQKHYFGNAFRDGTVTETVNEVISHGFGWIALKIRKMIDEIREEKSVREHLRAWVEEPKFIDTRTTGRNYFVTASSPRFNIYGNDFGWGKPVAYRSGVGNKFDGMLNVNPGAEDGSVDVETCLSADKWEALEQHEDLMRTVSAGNISI